MTIPNGAIRQTSRRRHAQRAKAEAERCPLCGNPISAATRATLDEKLRTQLEKVEQTLRDQLAHEQQRAVAEIAKARAEAAKTAQAQIRAFHAEQEAVMTARIKAARDVSERKLAEALAAEKSKSSEERIKLTERLAELKRRLENKTADELGSAAEIDLFQALSQEFGGYDKIVRVPRGQNGADVIHDVCDSGYVIGRIIYDSKAHARWQNRFVEKLRQNMIDHKADHGVLSSTVFPAGAGQLHIQDGIVVVTPGRAIVLAHLLRRQIVQVRMLRLGNQARDEKRDQLYKFLTSDRASQLFERISSLMDDMLELDTKETSAHQTTWRRRNDLIRRVQRLHGEFTVEVERIIGIAGEPR